MLKNNDLFALPAGPAELCFDKNDFMKKSFSVDDFLHEHRNSASLEIMRDDLGIYLKILRSAMIELINEDYADFVNLSSNLIGLDHSIDGIQKPLEQIKEEILSVKNALTDSVEEIKECLIQKKTLRKHRKSLQSLSKVRNSIEKLEDLLDNQVEKNNITPIVYERAALELIQLKFNCKFCENFLSSQQKEKAKILHSNLLDKLKVYFLSSLRSNNTDELERCLRIYATLDEFHAAEKSFQEELVGVYMHDIISENALQNSSQGLVGIYNKILDFVALNMKELLLLTYHTGKVKGFDFLLNSFWLEVENRLESHMSSIFAPGNPDSFYLKYKCTMDFLERIEAIIGNDDNVKAFRRHLSSRRFESKWNLSVYFQIRFQEIAGSLETELDQNIAVQVTEIKEEDFTIRAFQTAYKCIKKCWSDGIYLETLFPKFWKFTLQIISRMYSWIGETLKTLNKLNYDSKYSKEEFYVLIYTEEFLFMEKFADILKLVEPKMPPDVRPHFALLEKCIKESDQMLLEQLRCIEQAIIKELVGTSAKNIAHIGDIPRLYRKTNREVPNKQCSYVEQMLEPLKAFQIQFSNTVQQEKMVYILQSAASDINAKYYVAVTEVITSVQKTEESLRRLKNLREKSNTSTQSIVDRQTMSDDDKIRLQLQVDVMYWSNELEKIKISISNTEKLQDLLNLLVDVTKFKHTSDK